MSVKFRIDDQVLIVDDVRETTDSVVHKYDAFLNLLCADRYEFQRDAVRATLRFLVSDKYLDLEQLARENWGAREVIRQRHNSLDAYLSTMQLRAKKSVSLDLATGTGKSFVLYAIAAIALAEGLADRVLVLCPSLTIEEELLNKFRMLAGDSELATILAELGASVCIPGIKRGTGTIQRGDICIENIHAAYEGTGSSLRDSFRGVGSQTLVLNDEAHHLYSPPDQGLRKWMEFLQDPEFNFRQIVGVTGTPYIAGQNDKDNYFPDVIFRYGLKRAIADKVVKKPDYKLEETYRAHDWQKIYAVHEKNRLSYGHELKPITIVVTEEIATCVKVWHDLVNFIATETNISQEDAQKQAIWVTSSVPTSGAGKLSIDAAFLPRFDKDSPDKQRKDNLTSLKYVDDSSNPVEWIVSVSMLTEGWDVKNVFQIVPYETRAFSSKLLISQVLGRGLRIPPSLTRQPLVTINNHEAWSDNVGDLLKEILEVESTLTWGYDLRRSEFLFALHNLRYEPEQTTFETKRKSAAAPQVTFMPQNRKTTENATFSESGILAMEIEHRDLYEINDAVTLFRMFLRDKDATIAAAWPKVRLRQLILSGLRAGGYDQTFLSKANLLRLQQSFGPMFRELDTEHPRLSQMPKELAPVDLTAIARQTFSESALKENGFLWVENGDDTPFSGQDMHLWKQYQEFRKIAAEFPASASEEAKSIASRIDAVDSSKFKIPWNVLYTSYEPERKFSSLLFANAALFDSFVKMPNTGGYSFPYSYKPSKAARTHVANENFNPDFFLKLRGKQDILVVEIKAVDDDSNRNRAKCRDGLIHFDTLNQFLEEMGEVSRYQFYFLAEDDYTSFFEQIRINQYAGWRSSLMQEMQIDRGVFSES